jgi:hypothetical protein
MAFVGPKFRISMKSTLSIVSFVACAFYVIAKKSLPYSIVLVFSVHHKPILWMRWLKKQILFLTVLEAANFKIMERADSVSGEGPFPRL